MPHGRGCREPELSCHRHISLLHGRECREAKGVKLNSRMEEVSNIVNQSHWLSPVNPLLEISKYMSVNECRIFYVALMAMRQNLMEDRNLPMLLLPTGELLKMFGGNKGYYREIKNITARLAERQIRFNQKLYPLFDSIGFQPDKGGLYMLFCPRLRPLMVEMSSRDYLPVVAGAVFNLGSTYAIRCHAVAEILHFVLL